MEPDQTAANVLIIISLFLFGFICHLVTKIYFADAIIGPEKNDEELEIEDLDLFILALVLFIAFLCRCLVQNLQISIYFLYFRMFIPILTLIFTARAQDYASEVLYPDDLIPAEDREGKSQQFKLIYFLFSHNFWTGHRRTNFHFYYYNYNDNNNG